MNFQEMGCKLSQYFNPNAQTLYLLNKADILEFSESGACTNEGSRQSNILKDFIMPSLWQFQWKLLH